MRLSIERKPVKVYPDMKRVIARFFFNGDERARQVISRVMRLAPEEVFSIISPILQEYSKRHRNITKVLNRHCDKLQFLFPESGFDFENLQLYQKLLLGSYFTHEYSIESAAFFNPSIVEDPDQSELEVGEKRIIISFRAVGEGHISSIVFRRALLDKDANLVVLPVGNYIDEAEIVRSAVYDKKVFFKSAFATQINPQILKSVEGELGENFDFSVLRKLVMDAQELQPNIALKREYEKVLWLADAHYDLAFSLDTDISDRVLFPISEFERKGIEDARFVRFTEEDGKLAYYATYTAYDGSAIMPKLIKTRDFYNFRVMPLYGAGAHNKNLALFPRKINGKFAMMARIDGWSNYIMFSDNINVWENPVRIQEPKTPWEFTQIGNCGSPIETEDGWLVITHGVGPMRRYCLGASLLRLDDPAVEIGHLTEPLLIPNKEEREGYVPNVLYSCGSIIHNGKLVIPYGLSDYSSSFATVDVAALLQKLLDKSSAV
ncbi:glycosidase [Adhaeribacter aerolatus]|uniref:Glycosidase n=1 Tax=Adhaeribacter aerolatus TaxID=670289 RepID=A0A512B5E8_9BACT|nr:glycoside hydrolase family 130 protein [Adhaeribacter aerolatus]GEO07161.1 glycosidase [Adhaeribacter aerolatus]